ncbi:MAG: DUF1778 domain-containing protein [Desulfobulbaceae bacterium]|nr:DUF1778 domain-containing protein [Desulfobulbaceae bacterium]
MNTKKAEELPTRILLSEAQWNAFNKTLNRPSRKNPELKKLLKIGRLFSDKNL